MLPLQFLQRWQVAGVLLPIVVLVLALMPNILPWPHDQGADWLKFDKWGHGITFAALALWYTGQYARHLYWRLALALLIYGALIEVLQSMTTYRTAEWGDLAADGLGIVAGIVIALFGAGAWSLRAENWLKKRLG